VVVVVAAVLGIEVVEVVAALPVENTIANPRSRSSSGKTGRPNPTDLEPSSIC
jgi:hypothetical protein